jgi:hypothetical protein
MLNDGINAVGRLRNDPQAAMLRTKRPEELGGSDLIGVPLGVPLVVAEGQCGVVCSREPHCRLYA